MQAHSAGKQLSRMSLHPLGLRINNGDALYILAPLVSSICSSDPRERLYNCHSPSSNETAAGGYHIIVITGEQFSSDRALLIWSNIWTRTYALP